MDDSQMKDPVRAAAACSSFSSAQITTCVEGAEGAALLAVASADFNEALPGSTTIPHTFVDQADTEPDYATLKKALCAAGNKAPACSKAVPNTI
jgi:hypothetical protein